MADATSRLSSNGRVTIPKEIRDALGLEPGDELVMRVDGTPRRAGADVRAARTRPRRGSPGGRQRRDARRGPRRPPTERDDSRPPGPLRVATAGSSAAVDP